MNFYYDDFSENLNSDNFLYSDFDHPKELNESFVTDNEKENQMNQKVNQLIKLEEKSTAIKTLSISFNDKTIKENPPQICSYEYIYSKIEEAKIILFDKFVKDNILENEEIEMTRIGKKRKRTSLDEEIDKTIKYKKGRKNKQDNTKRSHNKSISDNIIKKIKCYLIKNLLFFVNTLLYNNTELKKKKLLKDLDYKNIDQLNKAIDLEMLDMPIKDLLSKDISPKFKTEKKECNKIMINYILDKYNNNEIINLVFNMTFREWINIFTLKKKISEIEGVSDETHKEIEQLLPKLGNLLNEIYEKNGKDNSYLSHFIFYLFNYEMWFFKKRERKLKKQNE